ncbi:MAG TPA: AarF/UbiB family protein, partial [Burkholderiales bacterium]|nr:AarF/UbiB family protein [Burkholderiales bacterium]
ELGPTFVKLGQILATRVDLLPPQWIAELEKLQDQAPPAASPAVHAQLTEDLGQPPEAAFAAFDPEPIAAGSIAQVHRARLVDGAEVAIKVRRPGIVPVVEADLRLLARLAEMLEATGPDIARLRPREVVRQFTRTVRAELDLAAECRNAERVAQSFRDNPAIVVPKVYWEWSGERVNVQEFIDGTPSRDPSALAAAGLDRRVLAHRGAQAMLKMVLEDGFFHADPHPGNVFYLPGNRVAFIDFGMAGHLSERRRDELVRLLAGLVGRDADSVVDVLLDWAGGERIDAEKLAVDIDAFIDRHHGVALQDLRMGAMLADMTALLREHSLALPADLALVLKACVTLETYGRELDPDFDMVGEAAPFLRAATLARSGPAALAKRGWRAAAALAQIAGELPQDLRELIRAARSGRLQMHFDLTSLQSFGRQVDTSANRLAIGIVTAALIVGSSIVMTVEGGPTLLGLPLFGLLGFVGALVGGAWLLVSILRSGGGR